MKNIILLLFIFISSCNTTKCYDFTELEEEIINKTYKLQNESYSEILDIWGVSSVSEYEIAIKSTKFTAFDTKTPITRYTKKAFKDFSLYMNLGSNTDTGQDKIVIYSGNIPIFTKYFTEEKVNLTFHLHEYTKLRFVVSNDNTQTSTPGAFMAYIKLKELN
jgi:hypothetical protein